MERKRQKESEGERAREVGGREKGRERYSEKKIDREREEDREGERERSIFNKELIKEHV